MIYARYKDCSFRKCEVKPSEHASKFYSIIRNCVLSVFSRRKYTFYHQKTLLDPLMVIPLLANQDLTPMLARQVCVFLLHFAFSTREACLEVPLGLPQTIHRIQWKIRGIQGMLCSIRDNHGKKKAFLKKSGEIREVLFSVSFYFRAMTFSILHHTYIRVWQLPISPLCISFCSVQSFWITNLYFMKPYFFIAKNWATDHPNPLLSRVVMKS